MANVVLPIIISGKSWIVAGGQTIFMKKGLTITDEAESWNPESQFGPTGERHKARAFKISGEPEGQLTAGLLDYFYAAFLTTGRANIGKTIVGNSVVVHDIDSNISYTLNSAGLFAPPSLMLGPGGVPFGQVTWIGIGDVSAQPTDAAFLATLGTATAQTSREDSAIITDIYSAALGARATPYDVMGSIDGFKLNFTHNIKLFPAGDVGYGDAKLISVGLNLSFIPSNLTDAQVQTLRAYQNTGAVLPGQQYAKAGEDLVITGTQVGWVFTAKQVGIKKQDSFWGADEHRHKALEFVNRSTSTSGAPDAYLAYTAPA